MIRPLLTDQDGTVLIGTIPRRGATITDQARFAAALAEADTSKIRRLVRWLMAPLA